MKTNSGGVGRRVDRPRGTIRTGQPHLKVLGGVVSPCGQSVWAVVLGVSPYLLLCYFRGRQRWSRATCVFMKIVKRKASCEHIKRIRTFHKWRWFQVFNYVPYPSHLLGPVSCNISISYCKCLCFLVIQSFMLCVC